MKKNFTVLLILFFSLQFVFSQGTDCSSSAPFCTGTSYSFPASTNVPQLGAVGCLGSSPNPAFYYLQVANSGPIDIYMSSTPNVDIDFICWGPFTSLAAACATNLMTNSGVDCSYSTNWNETANIPSAVTGQVYVLLITNFSNTVCDIGFSQTGGTGSTDCGILAPPISNNGPLCEGQTLNLTVGSPVVGATYSWTGPLGYVASDMNPIISNVNMGNAGIYTLVITVGGVSSPPVTTNVVINPNPVVTVDNPTICSGTSATINSNGATTYSWSNGLGSNPMTVAPLITTSYTVTGTSLGCVGTAISTVTVNQTPIVSATNTSICSGVQTQVLATGATTYIWSDGTLTDILTVTPSSTVSYTVTGTTNGCSSTAISTITVLSNAVLTINNPTICQGDNAILTPSGATTYAWSNGSTANTLTVNPATTTSYSVTGTLAGCTGTAVSTVVVNNNPIVTLNNPIICAGSSAIITSNGASTYLWSNGSLLNPISVSPLSTTSYTVTGTTNGCTGTAISTVTVNANPIVSVNNLTICNGISDTLTAVGATSYLWNTGSTTNPLIISPSSNTVYTVTGTTNGCVGTAISTVTVNSNPIATANNPTICFGETANLTASGGTDYFWSTGNTTNTISVTPVINTTYIVTVIDANGCSSTANSLVTVNANPIADAGNNSNMCAGTTVNLTGSGGTGYLWSTTETTVIITVAPVSSTTYTLTVTNVNGCSSTDQVLVTVIANPTVTTNNSVICSGQQATLIPVGATTYLWNTGSSNNPLIVSPLSTVSYTVTGTTNGCTGTAVSIVTVNPSPVINSLANNNNKCQPMEVPFIDSSTPAISIYSWDFGDPTSPNNTSNIQNPTHTYLNGGNYNVTITVTTAAGCVGTYTYTNMVTVYSNPIASFTATPPVASILTPTISYQDQSTGANTWYWDFGDPISGINNNSLLQNPSHTYSTEGSYPVILVVLSDHGCIDTLKQTVEVIDDILMIPNIITPNGDGKNDIFKITNIEKVPNNHLVIFNRWGKKVYEKDSYNNEWDGGKSPDGVYFIILTYKDNMEHRGTLTILNKN